MRLGQYDCRLEPGSRAHQAYGEAMISERHRHRYELNDELKKDLVAGGLKVTGVATFQDLSEIVEIEDHPWFIGVQFHPEFKSRPRNAHPLFREFVKAALMRRRASIGGDRELAANRTSE
jgi:CTP synthase